jgi:hypothetical protein
MTGEYAIVAHRSHCTAGIMDQLSMKLVLVALGENEVPKALHTREHAKSADAHLTTLETGFLLATNGS